MARLNRGNIQRVIAALEAAPDEKFSMMNFIAKPGDGYLPGSRKVTESLRLGRPVCGTTACIAGWAVIVLLGEKAPQIMNWAGKAEGLLGLTSQQAYALFYTGGARTRLLEPRRHHAISVLRYLLDTGKVDWDRFVRGAGDE